MRRRVVVAGVAGFVAGFAIRLEAGGPAPARFRFVEVPEAPK